jgi:hypothetical protein
VLVCLGEAHIARGAVVHDSRSDAEFGFGTRDAFVVRRLATFSLFQVESTLASLGIRMGERFSCHTDLVFWALLL